MKRYTLLAVIIAALICTSCWDRIELNRLGMAMAVAIDAAPNGADKVEVTTQFLKPQPPGQTARGGGGGDESKPYENLSAIGESVGEATQNLTSESARRLFFGQTQLLVLGENLAERDVRVIMERPGPGFETRRTARMVLVKGSGGKELLAAKVKLADIPAEGIGNLVEEQAATGLIPDIRLKEFLARLNSKTAAALLPAMTLVPDNFTSNEKQGGEKTVRAAGTAVFTEGRLVGYLSPAETRGLLWAQGQVKRTVVDVPFPGSPPTRKVGLDIRRLFSDVEMKVNGDRVAADIKLEVRADINEYGVLRDIAKPRSWSILNHQLSVCVQREVERTIRKSQQELRADIFNLGEQLRIQDNRNWSRLAPRWDEIYPVIKFNVEVRSILRHRGTTIIPPGVG